MYDYSEVLALLDRSDRFHEELERGFEKMRENGAAGRNEAVGILNALRGIYNDYNLVPMVVETDLQGRVTYANEHFLSASKYALDEILGQNINVLKNSHNHPGIYRDIWNHLDAKKAWRGQLRNTCKDYDSYWVDTVICPVLDAQGNITKYWSVSYNITRQMDVQHQLEAKNEELMDSMRYAKRIQNTILPDKKSMTKVMPDHFILYKPRDIVSGDFYWFTASIDKVFIAAVDCTGHGVPGAFMSLIGFNLLNQIVIQRRIQAPGLILTELHKGVRSSLKQDSEENKSRDGMDIALLCIDRFEDRLQFAGANNPLYWWNSRKNELEIVKGDKMSIGGEQMEDERIFTNHELEVSAGDCLYMFTDGFIDQFGGPDNKKFGSKRLRELVEANHHEKMSVQRALFNLAWRDWVQDDEQTDDVTLIGIRIPDDSELSDEKLTSKVPREGRDD